MKELSIEEKAKAYDEAIEIAKKWRNTPNVNKTPTFANRVIEELFPELKESEDEKIRKWIIDDIRYNMNNELLNNSEYKKKAEKAIVWLEKQSEQRSITNVPSREVILAIWDLGNEWKEHTNGSISTEYGTQLNYIQKHWLEKQSEKNTVKPKYHEGDWIACEELNTALIINIIDDNKYEVKFIDGSKGFFHIDYVDRLFHLWTIKDAKPGDILFHSDSASNGIFIFKELLNRGFSKKVICYCDYDSEDGFCLGENHTCCWTDARILHPATKEQCDTLIKAMTDAGYTFDFNKKELKKIEHRFHEKSIN